MRPELSGDIVRSGSRKPSVVWTEGFRTRLAAGSLPAILAGLLPRPILGHGQLKLTPVVMTAPLQPVNAAIWLRWSFSGYRIARPDG